MSENVLDGKTGHPRLCARECETCIFDPGSPFRKGPGKLDDGRFRQLVKDARDAETFVICHSTLDSDAAICRGFYERFSTNLLRIYGRLGDFTEVEPRLP